PPQSPSWGERREGATCTPSQSCRQASRSRPRRSSEGEWLPWAGWWAAPRRHHNIGLPCARDGAVGGGLGGGGVRREALINAAVSFATFFLTTLLERRLNKALPGADPTEMMQDYPLHVSERGRSLVPDTYNGIMCRSTHSLPALGRPFVYNAVVVRDGGRAKRGRER